MKTTNEQTLNNVIKDILSTYKLEDGINEARLVSVWDEVVGELISKHTEKIFVKGKKLYVKLDSPALKNELSYARNQLIKNLNKAVNNLIIENIVFL
ncbi:MAG: DUF721 domain-containing protein [Bacteroidales bacterium]|nr:DUF721 domain-containing protein [Bacteroidales bacterium]